MAGRDYFQERDKMNEKQLHQTSDNLKAAQEDQNPPERIADTLRRFLSGKKCEWCGIRPVAFGNEKVCKRCEVVYKRKTSRKAESIIQQLEYMVGEAYTEASLDGVDIADDLLKATDDIFLWGAVGVGKTWAMAALVKHFLCEGYECQRVNFDSFCSRVRATMNNNSKLTEWDIVKGLQVVDKLFIDDVGLRSKQETDFAYVTFYSILNARQECRLPTYISTNKSIEQLAHSFDQRIASRLGQGTVIEMKGEDRRKK